MALVLVAYSMVLFRLTEKMNGYLDFACEEGTAVFSCPTTKNPMHTYHESVVLGVTDCSIINLHQIIKRDYL